MTDIDLLPAIVYLNGFNIHQAYNRHAADGWLEDHVWPVQVDLDMSGSWKDHQEGELFTEYIIDTEPLKPKSMKDLNAIAKAALGGYEWIYYDDETHAHWTTVADGTDPMEGQVGPWRKTTLAEVREHDAYWAGVRERKRRQSSGGAG